MHRVTLLSLLLAAARSHLQLARWRKPQEPLIRVYRPASSQNGKPDIAWCWGGPYCTGQTGPTWQSGERAPAGIQGRIRIRYPRRPERLRLRGWRDIECGIDSCRGVGPKRVFELGLRRIRRDGGILGWAALFHLPKREGHLYLLLDGFWDPQHYAHWTFHLRLR